MKRSMSNFVIGARGRPNSESVSELTDRNKNSLRLEMIAEEKEKLVATEAALIEEAVSVDQTLNLVLMSGVYQPGPNYQSIEQRS